MPKNNSVCVGKTFELLFQCPCGFSKKCNDKKEIQSAFKRHNRFCETAKKSNVECFLHQNNYNVDDTIVLKSSRVQQLPTSEVGIVKY